MRGKKLTKLSIYQQHCMDKNANLQLRIDSSTDKAEKLRLTKQRIAQEARLRTRQRRQTTLD